MLPRVYQNNSMNRIFKTLIFLFSFYGSFGQADDYSGTWRLKFPLSNNAAEIEIKIASPERNMLYPALLTINCDSFQAVYELLLVKKNLRQLVISRNKFPVKEEPFSAGTWPITLNGSLDYSRDLKADPVLTLNRFPAKKYGTVLPDFANLTGPLKKTAMDLASLFKDQNLVFKKTSSVPWQGESAERILMPRLSSDYFGLLDTIYLPTRDGRINFSGNKKSSGDIISVSIDGKIILDQVEPGKRKLPEEILLDTGLNIVALFADNFYKMQPNKAQANFEFGRRKFNLDFNNRADLAAGFIVAKLYFEHDKESETRFQSMDFPISGGRTLNRNDKVLGSVIATSQQITLALWDDAVEDGDSVSININGKWIARGFPVKKSPQFLTVTLKPGPNAITFVADNLGSIPPNTSVLEIIDGKKRKSFAIETSLDQNNLLKIYYDYKPAE